MDGINKIDVISLDVNSYFDTNLDNNFNPGLDTTIFVPNFYKFDDNFGNFDDHIDSFIMLVSTLKAERKYTEGIVCLSSTMNDSELDLSRPIDFVHVVTPKTIKLVQGHGCSVTL